MSSVIFITSGQAQSDNIKWYLLLAQIEVFAKTYFVHRKFDKFGELKRHIETDENGGIERRTRRCQNS